MMGWGDKRKHPWILNLPKVRFVDSDSLGLKIVKILEDEADMFFNITGRVKIWDTAAPFAIGLGNGFDVGTVDGDPLVFPVPDIQHVSSVIIGRPGTLAWSLRSLSGRDTKTVPKSVG